MIRLAQFKMYVLKTSDALSKVRSMWLPLYTRSLGGGNPLILPFQRTTFFFRTIVLRTLALCKRKFAHFHWLTAGISKATTKQVFLTHSLPRRRVGSCRHAFERQQLFRPCFHVASLRLEAMHVGLVHQCRVAKLPLLQFFFFPAITCLVSGDFLRQFAAVSL